MPRSAVAVVTRLTRRVNGRHFAIRHCKEYCYAQDGPKSNEDRNARRSRFEWILQESQIQGVIQRKSAAMIEAMGMNADLLLGGIGRIAL